MSKSWHLQPPLHAFSDQENSSAEGGAKPVRGKSLKIAPVQAGALFSRRQGSDFRSICGDVLGPFCCQKSDRGHQCGHRLAETVSRSTNKKTNDACGSFWKCYGALWVAFGSPWGSLGSPGALLDITLEVHFGASCALSVSFWWAWIVCKHICLQNSIDLDNMW